MGYGSVTVNNTATLILEANPKRQELWLVNIDEDNPIYLGMDSGVTTANGFVLYETQTQSRSRGFGTWLGPMYGIVASGSATVRYWETVR